MQQWKTLKKELILNLGRFLKVEKHTIQLPDGKILYDWPWVVSPDYVLVLPVTENKKLLLFHQTKYAVEGTSLAPVGGYLEPGEDALAAAKRELKEETGCEAAEWIRLGNCPNNGNHGGGSGNLFIALHARKVSEPIIDDLEEMELVELTLEEAEKKLMQGEVKVMGWMTMIAMGLLYLKNS
ncbi:MAG: NUDIX hydrolase [Bacteroidetes bacterium]|nr:NUDIX hydrolase [Bacteroidota bacterium]